MEKKPAAKHGVVCSLKNDPFGYFGWPSVALMDDGTIVAASSGLRAYHVCPWGKTVLHFSKDNGNTWSDSVIVNNSPIDDRDAGVISLGGNKILISWFTHDTRWYLTSEWVKKYMTKEDYEKFATEVTKWNDEMVNSQLGSWIRISEDGNSWGEPVRVSVSAPHGPILLKNGELCYFGKGCFDKEIKNNKYDKNNYLLSTPIIAARSRDGGKTWIEMGEVPLEEGVYNENLHEPHVVELPSGKLIGLIRYQYSGEKYRDPKYQDFSIFQTESEDMGKTWTKAYPTGVYGSPPHVIRHSSGALVCVYGYRKEPFGERAMISYDQGKTWKSDIILRDDGIDLDLGYPASVELKDGSIFTIYYQKLPGEEKTSILWTRWRID